MDGSRYVHVGGPHRDAVDHVVKRLKRRPNNAASPGRHEEVLELGLFLKFGADITLAKISLYIWLQNLLRR